MSGASERDMSHVADHAAGIFESSRSRECHALGSPALPLSVPSPALLC